MDYDEAPNTLRRVAEAAEDVAAGMKKFSTLASSSAAEITDLVSKCFAISSALQYLARAITELWQISIYERYWYGIWDVAYSLDYTFKDIHRFVGEALKETLEDRTWRDINEYFYNESGNSLNRRLELYQAFLQTLTDSLKEGWPRDLDNFDDLASKIALLYKWQNMNSSRGSLPPTLGLQAKAAQSPICGLTKPPSFERRRPRFGQASPEQPLTRAAREEDDGEPWYGQRPPPPVPEVPVSPTSSNAFSTSSSTSHNNVVNQHWLPRLFERPPPTTALTATGRSACLAQDQPRIAEKLEEYDKLKEISFECGDLVVGFHQRKHDGRAMMVCKTIRPPKDQRECGRILALMDVKRTGPFLRFVEVSRRSSECFAVLRFTSYESEIPSQRSMGVARLRTNKTLEGLVIFFCTFLALRSEDSGDPVEDFDDHRLHKEEVLFMAVLKDDHYGHALKLCKDKESGVIRLQASALHGTIRKTPIWTAFITHQIHSPAWMNRAGPKVIRLADLHKYVFWEDYNPHVAPGCQQELNFARTCDADNFEAAIDELVNPPKKSKKKVGKGH
ncbi:MAG: hypothetical protein Q9217_001033 [Psora testacea]